MAAKADVTYDPAILLPSQIASEISNMGYVAEVMDTIQGNNRLDFIVSPRAFLQFQCNKCCNWSQFTNYISINMKFQFVLLKIVGDWYDLCVVRASYRVAFVGEKGRRVGERLVGHVEGVHRV